MKTSAAWSLALLAGAESALAMPGWGDVKAILGFEKGVEELKQLDAEIRSAEASQRRSVWAGWDRTASGSGWATGTGNPAPVVTGWNNTGSWGHGGYPAGWGGDANGGENGGDQDSSNAGEPIPQEDSEEYGSAPEDGSSSVDYNNNNSSPESSTLAPKHDGESSTILSTIQRSTPGPENVPPQTSGLEKSETWADATTIMPVPYGSYTPSGWTSSDFQADASGTTSLETRVTVTDVETVYSTVRPAASEYTSAGKKLTSSYDTTEILTSSFQSTVTITVSPTDSAVTEKPASTVSPSSGPANSGDESDKASPSNGGEDKATPGGTTSPKPVAHDPQASSAAQSTDVVTDLITTYVTVYPTSGEYTSEGTVSTGDYSATSTVTSTGRTAVAVPASSGNPSLAESAPNDSITTLTEDVTSIVEPHKTGEADSMTSPVGPAPTEYTTYSSLCTETSGGSTYTTWHTHSEVVSSRTANADSGITSQIAPSPSQYTTFSSLRTETSGGSTYTTWHTHSAPVSDVLSSSSADADAGLSAPSVPLTGTLPLAPYPTKESGSNLTSPNETGSTESQDIHSTTPSTFSDTASPTEGHYSHSASVSSTSTDATGPTAGHDTFPAGTLTTSAALTNSSSPPLLTPSSYTTFTSLCTENGTVATHTHSQPISNNGTAITASLTGTSSSSLTVSGPLSHGSNTSAPVVGPTGSASSSSSSSIALDSQTSFSVPSSSYGMNSTSSVAQPTEMSSSSSSASSSVPQTPETTLPATYETASSTSTSGANMTSQLDTSTASSSLSSIAVGMSSHSRNSTTPVRSTASVPASYGANSTSSVVGPTAPNSLSSATSESASRSSESSSSAGPTGVSGVPSYNANSTSAASESASHSGNSTAPASTSATAHLTLTNSMPTTYGVNSTSATIPTGSGQMPSNVANSTSGTVAPASSTSLSSTVSPSANYSGNSTSHAGPTGTGPSTSPAYVLPDYSANSTTTSGPTGTGVSSSTDPNMPSYSGNSTVSAGPTGTGQLPTITSELTSYSGNSTTLAGPTGTGEPSSTASGSPSYSGNSTLPAGPTGTGSSPGASGPASYSGNSTASAGPTGTAQTTPAASGLPSYSGNSTASVGPTGTGHVSSTVSGAPSYSGNSTAPVGPTGTGHITSTASGQPSYSGNSTTPVGPTGTGYTSHASGSPSYSGNSTAPMGPTGTGHLSTASGSPSYSGNTTAPAGPTGTGHVPTASGFPSYSGNATIPSGPTGTGRPPFSAWPSNSANATSHFGPTGTGGHMPPFASGRPSYHGNQTFPHPTGTGAPSEWPSHEWNFTLSARPTETGRPSISSHPTRSGRPSIPSHPTRSGRPSIPSHPTRPGRPSIPSHIGNSTAETSSIPTSSNSISTSTSSTCRSPPTETPQCVPCAGQPGSDPNNWCGYTALDSIYDVMPITCNKREYTFDITNTTLSPDGIERLALTVNGQMPGPAVEANWGDEVIVHVTNKLQDNGTTVHFHGIRQNYTNEMDGVPSITQCPIAPGESMTYRFWANSYGTSWYHSHFGLQTYEGVFGPLIINGPSSAPDAIEGEQFVALQDWGHEGVDAMYEAAQTVGPLPDHGPRTLDTGLINGMNVWGTDGAPGTTGKRFEMNVVKGKTYRLRLLNGAIQSTFAFYIDRHKLKVIAADFVPIVPYETDVLLINIGQRYDVLVTFDQEVDDYWMRSDNQQKCASLVEPRNIKGIVRYQGSAGKVPTSPAYTYTASCGDEPMSNLVPYYQMNVGGAEDQISKTATIGANGGIPNLYKWSLSGSTFTAQYDDPTLQAIVERETIPDYSGNLAISVPKLGEWVYVIIDTPVPVAHPIHLHGHDFFVLAQGMGSYTSATELNLRNPPRRDVAQMPADPTTGKGGYLVVAFYTDNPGAWLMHCHIGWHSAMGFALQIITNQEGINETVKDTCAMQDTCDSWKRYAEINDVEVEDSGV